MSTSDPFLPYGDPPSDADEAARERDLRDDPEDDTAADVNEQTDGGEDPDAEQAAARERMHAESTPFRRPSPGDRLTAEQLAAEESAAEETAAEESSAD
jgi:hypothetical protein